MFLVAVFENHFFKFGSLQEKILCRVCFDEPIDMVLLPCRHHILCR